MTAKKTLDFCTAVIPTLCILGVLLFVTEYFAKSTGPNASVTIAAVMLCAISAIMPTITYVVYEGRRDSVVKAGAIVSFLMAGAFLYSLGTLFWAIVGAVALVISIVAGHRANVAELP